MVDVDVIPRDTVGDACDRDFLHGVYYAVFPGAPLRVGGGGIAGLDWLCAGFFLPPIPG